MQWSVNLISTIFGQLLTRFFFNIFLYALEKIKKYTKSQKIKKKNEIDCMDILDPQIFEFIRKFHPHKLHLRTGEIRKKLYI